MKNIERHYLEKELEDQLANDPSIFQFFQTNGFDGVFVWDLENQEHKWMSDSFWILLGYNPEKKTHLLSDWKKVVYPDDMQNALYDIKLHCENSPSPYKQELRYQHQDGSIIWTKCSGIALRDQAGKVIRILGFHTDITRLKDTEKKLRHSMKELKKLTRYDSHTSLYNQCAFAETFEQQLLIASREHMPISLAVVNIDNFTHINESLSRLEGDKALLKTAETLRNVARDSDIIARFNDDNFVILMFNSNHKDSQLAAERVRIGVETTVTAGSENVTVSVGVATFGEKSMAGIDLSPSEICQQMLNTANKALFRAKSSGRNQICY